MPAGPAIAWAGRRTGGDLGALWVIEGTGSYRAQLARQAALAGYRTVEAAPMGSAGRRGIGKSDPIDARRIAAAVLPLDEQQLRTPRVDQGNRAAAQILLTGRDELTGERTRAVNALTALVRIADLGINARHSLGAGKIGEISRWHPREEDLAAAPAPRLSGWPRGSAPSTPRLRTTRTESASSSMPAPPQPWSRRPGSGLSPPPLSWSRGPIPDGSGTRPRSPPLQA